MGNGDFTGSKSSSKSSGNIGDIEFLMNTEDENKVIINSLYAFYLYAPYRYVPEFERY